MRKAISNIGYALSPSVYFGGFLAYFSPLLGGLLFLAFLSMNLHTLCKAPLHG